VVTSMHDGEALNFGIDAHSTTIAVRPCRRVRRADLQALEKLGRRRLILDKARGIYADPNQVHYVNHRPLVPLARSLNIRPRPKHARSSSRPGLRGVARRSRLAGPT
jgi:hypothetical protein